MDFNNLSKMMDCQSDRQHSSKADVPSIVWAGNVLTKRQILYSPSSFEQSQVEAHQGEFCSPGQFAAMFCELMPRVMSYGGADLLCSCQHSSCNGPFPRQTF